MSQVLSLNGFGEVAAALALFFASHSLPALPGMRARLARGLGERGYVIVHSLVATVTLVWLILATLEAPRIELWGFHPWTRWVPLLVMPLACVLLVAGLTSANPYSLGLGAKGFDPARPGVVGLTRHPVLWAAALWSGAHLFPNGELRALLLFGALCGFSLMGMRLFDRRRARSMGADWSQPLGRPRGLGWRVALGLALYAGLLLAHGALFGVSPLEY